jgi:hypothetical protein
MNEYESMRARAIGEKMLKGLIIQKEHLDNILNGLKTVEIRKQNTKKREKIALCNKGKIYGFAQIVDSYQIPRTELLIHKLQ